MEDVLMADDFLEQSKTGILIDVRSPSEFEAGHIPGARNLPLFSDNERAEIGTRYVQYGKDNAVVRGLEIVGPKLAGFVKQARQWADGTPIYMYCWRGGMRSGSMAWLFRTAGLTTYLLSGGYKAYRNSFAQLLEAHPWQLLILGGPTGCGKTEVLHQLQRMEQQVIDLEGLAHHKGSAFGSLGETAQPTTEQFTNQLHALMRTFNPARPVWCEGESASIGKVVIPSAFYALMLSAPFLNLEIPYQERIRHILNDYGTFQPDELILSFRKIEKRLGGEATRKAIECVEQNNLESAVCIALNYYDKGYRRSSGKQWPNQIPCLWDDSDPAVIARKLLALYENGCNVGIEQVQQLAKIR